MHQALGSVRRAHDFILAAAAAVGAVVRVVLFHALRKTRESESVQNTTATATAFTALVAAAAAVVASVIGIVAVVILGVAIAERRCRGCRARFGCRSSAEAFHRGKFAQGFELNGPRLPRRARVHEVGHM